MCLTLLLAGTVPGPLPTGQCGPAVVHDGSLLVGTQPVEMNRGTAAMIAAAACIARHFDDPAPQAVIAGDQGTRSGSRLVYHRLRTELRRQHPRVVCGHYIVPDIGLHNQVLAAARTCSPRPILIADAGFMYVAKASGAAAEYDLFLPDIGELAFLADDQALHPAYTRGFLSRMECTPAELVAHARQAGTARNLCIKGSIDSIYTGDRCRETIDTPMVPALEPIGGTGDTITGMAAGLIAHGLEIAHACATACRANRLAALRTPLTPASGIEAILTALPAVLDEALTAGERTAQAAP